MRHSAPHWMNGRAAMADIVIAAFNARYAHSSFSARYLLANLGELQKQAELLGYDSHAAYIQEIRMAKDPGTVSQFLTELGSKMAPLWQEEQGVMLRMKEDEMKELGRDFDGKLNFWDFR